MTFMCLDEKSGIEISCKVTIKLLKVNENTIGVEFGRVEGDNLLFYQEYKYLSEQLKDINNVVYEGIVQHPDHTDSNE